MAPPHIPRSCLCELTCLQGRACPRHGHWGAREDTADGRARPRPRPCRNSQLPAPAVHVSTLVLPRVTLRLSWPRRELVTPSDLLAGGHTGPTGEPVCRVGSIQAAMVLPAGSMWLSQRQRARVGENTMTQER